MSAKKKKPAQSNPRLNPQERLCPLYDELSIALYPTADAGEMGMRVRDNCAEEHQM